MKIDSGGDFNLVLTAEGKLLSWGNNQFGQLGNHTTQYSEVPKPVHNLSNIRIKDFSCGDQFVAAISEEGKLYTWGYGSDGQLGHKTTVDITTPKQVDFAKKVVKVSCGQGHVGVITKDNELFMFGRGKEG